MSHGSSAVGDPQQSLLIGCRRMAHADNNACIMTVFGQSKVRIMLWSHGNIPNHTLRCFLIHGKLLYRRNSNCFRRLSALVIHVKIWSLKMDAKDLGPLIALFCNLCYIGNCLCQNLRHLSYCRRKNRGNSLLWNPSHPVPKSLRLSIIRIKSISPMCMNINKSRQNPFTAIIYIRRM